MYILGGALQSRENSSAVWVRQCSVVTLNTVTVGNSVLLGERRTSGLRIARVLFKKNIKNFLSKSFGYVNITTEAVYLFFMKISQLFTLSNKKYLCLHSIWISAKFVKKFKLFLNHWTHSDVFLFRIYMFDSRSWLSTVVRENISGCLRGGSEAHL